MSEVRSVSTPAGPVGGSPQPVAAPSNEDIVNQAVEGGWKNYSRPSMPVKVVVAHQALGYAAPPVGDPKCKAYVFAWEHPQTKGDKGECIKIDDPTAGKFRHVIQRDLPEQSVAELRKRNEAPNGIDQWATPTIERKQNGEESICEMRGYHPAKVDGKNIQQDCTGTYNSIPRQEEAAEVKKRVTFQTGYGAAVTLEPGDFIVRSMKDGKYEYTPVQRPAFLATRK